MRNIIPNTIKMTAYLDSNIFIFAALDSSEKGKKARDILKKTHEEGIVTFTSSLTIDEVVWSILKQTKNRALAIEQGARILELKSIGIVNIDEKIMRGALNLMKIHLSLKPRDAIHLSAALFIGASVMISDDSDFDEVNDIKRKSL